MSGEKDTQFWNNIARKYAKDKIADMAGYETTISSVRDRLKPKHAVLEIGCGTGSTAIILSPNVTEYVATDFSAEMIEIAKEKITELNKHDEGYKNLTFQIENSESQSLPKEHFDVALAFSLLHLVPDLDATLRAVHRTLKPQGLFISKTSSLKMMNPLIRIAIPVMQKLGKAPFVNSFTPEELDSAIVSAGFEIIETSWHATRGKDTRPYIVARKI